MQLSCQSSEVKIKLEAKCLHLLEMSWRRKNKDKVCLIIFFKCLNIWVLLSAFWKWNQWPIRPNACVHEMPWTLGKSHIIFVWINLLADVWHCLEIETRQKNIDKDRPELIFCLIWSYWTDSKLFKRNMSFCFLPTLGQEILKWSQILEFPSVTTNLRFKHCCVLILLLFWFLLPNFFSPGLWAPK